MSLSIWSRSRSLTKCANDVKVTAVHTRHCLSGAGLGHSQNVLMMSRSLQCVILSVWNRSVSLAKCANDVKVTAVHACYCLSGAGLGHRQPMPWATLFPKASKKALDLMGKMLVMNPADRITVERALKHPFMSKYHDPDDEPICVPSFEFDFEKEVSLNWDGLKNIKNVTEQNE